jgi:hypothetical protein
MKMTIEQHKALHSEIQRRASDDFCRILDRRQSVQLLLFIDGYSHPFVCEYHLHPSL